MDKIGKIGFLGGGKITQAMASGFISAGLIKLESIIASVHPDDKVSLESLKQMGLKTVVQNDPVVEESDIVFISLKSIVVPTVLKEIKPKSDGKLFISLAMGITLETMENSLSPNARVIRVMPNTPMTVKAGCSVLVRGCKATADDVQITENLFKSIGTCEEVDEYQIDAATALSGSGPAYIFVLIEALADGAVRMGMPRDLAYRLASQTVMGSGKLVLETGTHPGELKDNVTSPAGSTAAGLRHLEANGFRAAVAGAIEAATLRCRETSKK